MSWMLLTLSYGLIKGVREIVKKKSLERNTVVEVLFFYTLFGFLLLIPTYKQAAGVPLNIMVFIIFKSLIIFLAWIASFHAIKKVPISLYGILDLSRVLFATFLAMLVLHEKLSAFRVIGLIFVTAGLIMLKFKKDKGQEKEVHYIYVILAFASCLLNAASGLLDKILTKTITPDQLQFWYMLYLVLFYAAYLLFEFLVKKHVNVVVAVKNGWIWLLSILFIIADKALFIANHNPDSKITVMTLIKQSGCIVTILAGKFIFKEKNIAYKLICAAVIIVGIVIGVM